MLSQVGGKYTKTPVSRNGGLLRTQQFYLTQPHLICTEVLAANGAAGEIFLGFRGCEEKFTGLQALGLAKVSIDVLANFVSRFDRMHPQISTKFRPLLDRYFRFW